MTSDQRLQIQLESDAASRLAAALLTTRAQVLDPQHAAKLFFECLDAIEKERQERIKTLTAKRAKKS